MRSVGASIILLFSLFLVLQRPLAQEPSLVKKGKMLYADNFDHGLKQWTTEYERIPSSSIEAVSGELIVDVAGGATVWFKQKLSGNIMIEYTRKVVVAGGANDRLSDLNQFWMASDPRNVNLFTRNGNFAAYDSLQLYYLGYGGNTNTTTRFRKYTGNGDRLLLGEFTDSTHLLKPNKEYLVAITMNKGRISCLIDGKLLFSYLDPAPLRSGYFGFRTTQSRQSINAFKVYELN